MNTGDLELGKGFEFGFATTVVDELVEGGKGYASGPERALLSALLFDGIQSYISYILATDSKSKSKHAEAFQWVMDGSTEYAFAFNSVCDALGINPEYLRFGLANASNSLLSEVGKSRRNF
jgi:hypothetical protein